MKSKSQAVEITTFRLQGGSFSEFIECNKKDIDEWLKKQKGFQSRHMIQQEDGMVMDMVFWDRESDGTAAMHRIIRETADSQVHTMVDHGTVSWSIYAVGHFMSQGL